MANPRILALAALLLAGPAAAASVAPEPMVSDEAAAAWDGPQFVQADRAGRVFFLRGDTLDVFSLTKDGGLSKLTRLAAPLDKGELTLRAVLSLSGDRWLVYAPSAVRLFVDGEEKALPSLDWTPWTVGFLRDTPVVAAIPRPSPAAQRHALSEPVEVPWFLSLAGDRWSALTVISKDRVGRSMKEGGMNGAIAENAVFLKGDREGRLWAARQYAYRVQRFSPTGRVLTELTVDGGKVREKEKQGKGIEIKLHGANDNPTEATQNPRAEKATFFAFTGQPVILDLTEGLDGKLYLLVRLQDGGIALDRFDDAREALDRVTLQMKAPTSGTFTIAAGRAALYIAAFRAKDGRWRIPWDLLDGAKWKPVEGVEIDGGPASAGEGAGSTSTGKP